MDKTYRCPSCKNDKPCTDEHWLPSSLQIAASRPDRTGIGYCRPCALVKRKAYTEKLKAAKLTRTRKPVDNKVRGKLYVIGPKQNENNQYPYKIGISSGTSIQNRLVALQTSHWIELYVIYESDVMDDVRAIESKLHNLYRARKVRGEWFRIKDEDINDIKKMVTK